MNNEEERHYNKLKEFDRMDAENYKYKLEDKKRREKKQYEESYVPSSSYKKYEPYVAKGGKILCDTYPDKETDEEYRKKIIDEITKYVPIKAMKFEGFIKCSENFMLLVRSLAIESRCVAKVILPFRYGGWDCERKEDEIKMEEQFLRAEILFDNRQINLVFTMRNITLDCSKQEDPPYDSYDLSERFIAGMLYKILKSGYKISKNLIEDILSYIRRDRDKKSFLDSNRRYDEPVRILTICEMIVDLNKKTKDIKVVDTILLYKASYGRYVDVYEKIDYSSYEWDNFGRFQKMFKTANNFAKVEVHIVSSLREEESELRERINNVKNLKVKIKVEEVF